MNHTQAFSCAGFLGAVIFGMRREKLTGKASNIQMRYNAIVSEQWLYMHREKGTL